MVVERIYIKASNAAINDCTVLRTNGERKIIRSGPYGVVAIFSCSIAHSLQLMNVVGAGIQKRGINKKRRQDCCHGACHCKDCTIRREYFGIGCRNLNAVRHKMPRQFDRRRVRRINGGPRPSGTQSENADQKFLRLESRNVNNGLFLV